MTHFCKGLGEMEIDGEDAILQCQNVMNDPLGG
jgi:hypothetical protein